MTATMIPSRDMTFQLVKWLEGRQQLAENLELKIEAINEWSEPESEPEMSID